MTDQEEHAGNGTDAWDAYWRNARLAPSVRDGGPQDIMLERFWTQLFLRMMPPQAAGTGILDIGCGSGAVTRFALSAAAEVRRADDFHLFGLDISPAAAAEIAGRHPAVRCVAADAGRLPFADGAFAIVASQFGLEYASPGAVAESARVLAAGGVFAAVLHMRDGGIFRECAQNLDAIDRFRQSGVLSLFERLFRAAADGPADAEPVHRADRALADAVKTVESIFGKHGREVAGGMLFRIYADVAHMYRRLRSYAPDEVFRWVEIKSAELDSYAGRMASMLDAALDPAGIERLTVGLETAGLVVRTRDTLNMGQPGVPSAWITVAGRA